MILVVDDQPMVLAAIARMVRRSGLWALEASGGAEALRVLESRTDVTILLTDCDMPVVSGPVLVREVMERWPAMRIIAMSGKPRSPEMPTEITFIAKPFRASALMAMLRTPAVDRAEARTAFLAP